MVVGAVAAFVVVMCGLRSATKRLNASRKNFDSADVDVEEKDDDEVVEEKDEPEPGGFSNAVQFYDELDRVCSKSPNRPEILRAMHDVILFLEDGCTAEGSQSVQDLWVMILSAANVGALANFPRSAVEESLLGEVQRTGTDQDRMSRAVSASASLLEILFREDKEERLWRLS